MSEMSERQAEPAWMTDPDRDDHEIQFADEGHEPEEYDPGPGVDDEGGMSEYRHYAEWQEIDRAEAARYEAEAGQ